MPSNCRTRVKKRQVEFLTGRFAAKEALAKALGTGIGSHFSWSIIPMNSGAPELIWCLDRQDQVQAYRFHLSVSHTAKYAVAQVIIEE